MSGHALIVSDATPARRDRNELGLRVRRCSTLKVHLLPPNASVDIAGTPIHSTSSCSAALIRISGLPLYVSIRPVTLTRFPSIPDNTGDLLTGDVGGIQPVKVWLG